MPQFSQPPEEPTTPETIPGALDELRTRVDQLQDEVQELRFDMKENTRATEEVVKNTADIVDIMESAKGAWKVLEALSKIAKAIAMVLVFCGLMLAAIKGYFITNSDGSPPQ